MTWHFPLEAHFFPGKKLVFPGAVACMDLSPGRPWARGGIKPCGIPTAPSCPRKPKGRRWVSITLTPLLLWDTVPPPLTTPGGKKDCGTPHSLDPVLRWLGVSISLWVGAGCRGLLPWRGSEQSVCAVWLSVHHEYPGVRTRSLLARANTLSNMIACEEGMPQFTWDL